MASSPQAFVSVSCSLKWDNVKKELDGFAAMATSCKGGRITIEEFAGFLKLPVNPALEELFALFDRVRHMYTYSSQLNFIFAQWHTIIVFHPDDLVISYKL